jgi:hypothetical protein
VPAVGRLGGVRQTVPHALSLDCARRIVAASAKAGAKATGAQLWWLPRHRSPIGCGGAVARYAACAAR